MPAEVIPISDWFSVQNNSDGRAVIDIRGVIGLEKEAEDWGFEASGTVSQFEEELKNLGDVREIEVNIYSGGGSFFAGLAMHNILARHPARVVANVDGICASAATLLLMAADEVRIPENAYVMIHNASSYEAGDYRALTAMAERLKKYSRDIANIYTSRIEDNTDRDDRAAILSEVIEMMDAETWMTGAEAAEVGLADRATEEMEIAACIAPRDPRMNLAPVIDSDRVPEPVRALFDSPAAANSDGPVNGDVANHYTEPESEPIELMPEEPNASAAPESPQNAEPTPEVENAESTAPEVTVTDAPAEPQATVEENEPAPAAPATPAVEPAPEQPAEPNLAESLANITNTLSTINQRLEAVEGERERQAQLSAAGVDPNAWGNTPPVAAAPDANDEPTIDVENTDPMKLISLGVEKSQRRAG